MFPIFKLNYVINNEISKIYVFHGNEPISREESFATINQRLELFTEEEFDYIQRNGISIEYIKKFIHPDDTIIRIKEKIFTELTELNISVDEIYLFYLTNKKHNIDDILFDFQNNSIHDQVIINKLKLFLMNFVKSTTDISILDETKDHSLRVLSRKFSNITIAGYWWFTNNKNQIRSAMKKRFEMLGTGHKAFYSDSRVTEQIIYKSKTYRNLIIKNLFDLLQEGQQAGRLITEKEINSLLSELFYLND